MFKDFEKAVVMIKHLESELNFLKIGKYYERLMLGLHTNAALILLYLKYFVEKIEGHEKIFLEAEFQRNFKEAIKICRKNNWDYEYALNTLRNGLFHKDIGIIELSMKMFKLLGDENAYKAMELAIKKYNVT